MPKINIETFIAEILDEDTEFDLAELCHTCQVPAEFLMELIEFGALEPLGESPQDWVFNTQAFHRSRVAVRLKNDFDLQTSAIAIILDLLDEMRVLRQQVRLIENGKFPT
ncbi:MAG: chaperone modulator CbpM [Gammaproteobacteria bacterium]